MEADRMEENCNTTIQTDGQDKGDLDHQETGDLENSTEVEHVENKERNGKSKEEDKEIKQNPITRQYNKDTWIKAQIKTR